MKAIVESLSDIPESLRGEYEARDGKYILKLDGDVPGLVKADALTEAHERVKEFRDTNIGLRTQLEELATRFKGFDPAEYAALKENAAKLNKAGGGDDVLVQLQELRKTIQEGDRARNDQAAQLAKKDLETILTREGIAAGIEAAAMTDYISRGMGSFVYRDGEAVAMDGERPAYSKSNPAEPMRVNEWVETLAKDAPHLFKRSTGGGATGGTGGNSNHVATWDGSDKSLLENLDAIAAGRMVLKE